MGGKCKNNKDHVWSDWVTDWDKKRGKIRWRKCVVCGEVEKDEDLLTQPKMEIPRGVLPVVKGDSTDARRMHP